MVHISLKPHNLVFYILPDIFILFRGRKYCMPFMLILMFTVSCAVHFSLWLQVSTQHLSSGLRMSFKIICSAGLPCINLLDSFWLKVSSFYLPFSRVVSPDTKHHVNELLVSLVCFECAAFVISYCPLLLIAIKYKGLIVIHTYWMNFLKLP